MTNLKTRKVTSAGVELAVHELGDPQAPTILLLHGYPDTQAVWDGVAARLSDRFHVVTYDVRGAGESSAPATSEGYGLEYLMEDALTVLKSVAPGKKAHLVGHDWGSVQGWEVATHVHAGRHLASFTSISGPCLDHLGLWLRETLTHPDPARLAVMAEQAGRSWYVGALMVPGFPEVVWPTLWGPTWPAFLNFGEGVHDRPQPTLVSDGVHGSWLYRQNVWERMRHPHPNPKARVPVQLVIPQRDRYLSPALYERLDAWVPDLTRRTVDAGHWVPRTHPDLLAEWIADFAIAHDAGQPAEAVS